VLNQQGLDERRQRAVRLLGRHVSSSLYVWSHANQERCAFGVFRKSFSTGNRKVEEAMQATEQRRPIVITVASAKGGSMKSTLNQEKPWER
jgi:hypothetical protein